MKAWRPRVPIPEKVPVALAKEIYRWNSCRENGFQEEEDNRGVNGGQSIHPVYRPVSCHDDDDGKFFELLSRMAWIKSYSKYLHMFHIIWATIK